MVEERDVVIVGAGIAGLVAARQLRDLDPLVLEADDHVGGRIASRQRGDLALSVGAHMFPPPDSVVGRLVAACGLEVLPITGSMLNVHLRGRLVRDTRPELFPFRLPLSLGGRVSFARAGLRVKRAGEEYMRLVEPRPGDSDADIRLRALRYGGDQSFADFLGRVHPEAFAIFRALANRSIAEPSEISHGSMAALFGYVWDSCDLGRNMRGGSGRLPEALGRELGNLVRLDARVTEVVRDGERVRVAVAGAHGGEIRARCLIVTVPAPQARGFLPQLPPEADEALARVTYGPMTVLSVLTDETGPMPWDDLYSILTPDKSFNMLFNHANFARGAGLPKTGSVLMVYAGGGRARVLQALDEEQIRDRFLDDLYAIYPQVRDHLAETWVQKWQHAGPFAAPGRWRAQALLERGVDDRIFFAGDGVSEFVSMETAARTGVDAAHHVQRVLGAVPARA